MSEAIVITGIGYVMPPGFTQALQAKDLSTPPETPEITGFEVVDGAPAYGHEIADFKFEEHLPNFKTYVDSTSALAMAAAKLALQDAGMLDPATRPAGLDIGCSYGTTFGCLDSMGLFWKKIKGGNPKFAQPLVFTHGYANSPSSLVCIEYGLRGAAGTFSGSFVSGCEALQFAINQIQMGSSDCMLVGASESLTLALHTHLFAMKQLTNNPSQDRGVVPSEGAAFLLLERESSAKARNKTVLGKFLGRGVALSGASRENSQSAWSATLERLALQSGATGVQQEVFLGTQPEKLSNTGVKQVELTSFIGETFSISGLAGLIWTLKNPGSVLSENRGLENRALVTVSDTEGKLGVIAVGS